MSGAERNPKATTFCVGAPRSGTTLIASLICEGPNVLPMLPECTFMTHLIREFHDILHYADRPRFKAWANTEMDLVEIFAPSIRGFVRMALSHFVNRSENILVLKDPELTPYLDCLPRFFRDFRTVCVVRDPRAVHESHRRALAAKGETVDFERSAAELFNYYYRAHESKLARIGDVFFLSFEKIVSKDEEEFRRLEHHLGYKVGRVGYRKVAFEFDRNDPFFSKNYGTPIGQATSVAPDSSEETARLQSIFSGYNRIYGWW